MFIPAEQLLGPGAVTSEFFLSCQRGKTSSHWSGTVLGCLPRDYVGTCFCFSRLLCSLGVDSEGMFFLAGLTHLVLRKQESKFSCSEQWTKSRKAGSGWTYPVGEAGWANVGKRASFFPCLWGKQGAGKEMGRSAGQVQMVFLLFMVLNEDVINVCLVI